MSDAGGDKKHLASDRRRLQAREQGQVAKSQDLTSAGLLLLAVGTLHFFGANASDELASAIRSALSEPLVGPYASQDATQQLLRLAGQTTLAVAPILLLMMFGGVMMNVVQTGLILAPSKLAPKLSNIDPMSGAKRILSLQSVMRLAFGLCKVGLISVVAYFALVHHRDAVLAMSGLSVPELAAGMFSTVVGVCLWIGVGLFVLALMEYVFQWWKSEQDMMMTDQEVREEAKESQGDPQMMARRRQVARQLAMDRVGKEVPKADVVVSNPTELAIAIRYDPQTMPAPIVVAKGAGLIAQRIRRLALENGIPVVERKPLAQFLYKSIEVGQEIPADQYQAVAEVLRYVYQLQGKSLPKVA